MLRPWDLLVCALCLCVGQRLVVGGTTLATTLSTTEAGSVCTVDTAGQETCNSVTETSTSDGSSSSVCTGQGTWSLVVNAAEGTTVNFTPGDVNQTNFVSNTTTNGATTFQYNVGCCYDVTVHYSNSTTCTLKVGTIESPGTPASSISFPEDTFAHVAIGCGGGIVVMLCLVFALGAICNKDQKKQAKYKAKIGEVGNQQKNVEQPRSPSQDTPRRPALDAVFDTGPRPGSRAGYDDRAMVDPTTSSQGGYSDRPMPDPRPSSHGGYNGRPLPDPREQSAPYDDPRRQDNDGYDNWSFQGDDYERPRHQTQSAAPQREHPQQMRRHTEAPPHGTPRYDNHGEAARNFNDPYGGYDRYDRREGDRHGRYSEMPQYDRGMRTGPPADFDMY
ncbi:uncharacterized protein [Branchiostoma lanceolatum]|uniref:uncharacterized protein n=1 Tax=Branchiostoma lanceolatum TaxID=7740 RepID=UPI003453EC95